MYDAAVVVLTRDIRRKRHGDDSGSRDHRRQVQLPDPAMSDAADAKGGVQGGRRQRDVVAVECLAGDVQMRDRKSTRLNSSHSQISYAVLCLTKQNEYERAP